MADALWRTDGDARPFGDATSVGDAEAGWGWTIVRLDDEGVKRDVRVLIARTVDVSAALENYESQQALNTSGRTAVEKFIDREDPPEAAVITTAGVTEQQ